MVGQYVGALTGQNMGVAMHLRCPAGGPATLLKRRRRQQLLLASKGVPISHWEKRDVRELDAYFWELVDMLDTSKQAEAEE